MPGRKAVGILFTGDERHELEARARRRKTARGDAMRASIVLLAASGMALFITGSTFWGRLLPVGLALIALAPVVAAVPEWSPLIFAAAVTAALWFWAYSAWKYFGPRVAGEAAAGSQSPGGMPAKIAV